MKKAFLSVLGLTLVGSLSQACIEGGDLFQLKTPGGEIIANYEIKTGDLKASSRSFSVKNAYFVTVKGKKVVLGKSVCEGTENCEKLNVSQIKAAKTFLFIYEKFGEPRSNAIIAHDLFLGPQASVAKGAFGPVPPPSPQVGEVEELRELDCSTKVQ
ncbi:MAG: hypothetical protein JNM39_11535 [Bdellovibrionaceae bacterium]|nr:hypothetical protein [Pseudobdellovibrionaceae bacterium]